MSASSGTAKVGGRRGTIRRGAANDVPVAAVGGRGSKHPVTRLNSYRPFSVATASTQRGPAHSNQLIPP